MNRHLLGRRQFNALCAAIGQGSWHLGQGRHPAGLEEEALRTGISLGMSLIDTSGNYGDGRSERLISRVIAETSLASTSHAVSIHLIGLNFGDQYKPSLPNSAAHAAIGHAAALPSSVMNSRLFIDRSAFDPAAKASSQHIELAAISQPGGLLLGHCGLPFSGREMTVMGWRLAAVVTS